MPILNLSDEEIFSSLNVVLVGYVLLIFLPRWSYTRTITLCIVFMYSLLYLLLVIDYIQKNQHKLDTVDFSSLQGVVTLFQDPSAVMGGWTHYIAFDLMVARYIVFDAIEENIHHLMIVPLIPLTLMLGPIGLFSYLVLKACKRNTSYWYSIFKKFDVDIAMYCFVTFLSLVMVWWIFVFPGTTYLAIPSTADFRHQLITDILSDPAFPERKPILLTKYRGQSLIAFLHIVPSGLWALMIPFQLYSPLRRNFPMIHRCCGYILFSTVPLITAGVVAIHMKKVDFECDFPEDTRRSHFSEWGLSPFSDSFFALKVYIYLVASYFCISAAIALQYAMLKHDYYHHKIWVIRHVSSGLWVALHRFYFISRQANTPSQQKAAFYDADVLAPIVGILIGELYLYFRMPSKTKFVETAIKYHDHKLISRNHIKSS